MQRTPTCWIWIGATGKGYDTYGRFNLAGKTVRVHRLIYQILIGTIPDGLELRHICDNPRCVNPAHLCPSSHAENMADMKAKGRGNGRLRGVTHCAKGHLLDGENVITRTSGDRTFRLCKICRCNTERRFTLLDSARRAALPKDIHRTCSHCGTHFMQSRHAGRPAVYCSKLCRYLTWKKKHYEQTA